MKLKMLVASALLGASIVIPAATPAAADDFYFTFTNNVGNVSGSVTGEVFGLVDNSTSAATSVEILTWPSALIPAGSQPYYSAPIDATTWASQNGNSFTETNGVVTGGGFHADNATAVSTLDRLWLNFGPCSSGPTCSFLSLGSGDSQFVWTGVAGTTFCSVTSGACSTLGGVPEPATWALLMVGLGALGAALRIGRRKAALVVA